jgi:hypothetical protein
MTSDVIRRHYMSYNPLFHNCLHGHNFAKSEPMNGLEHLPTDSSTPLTSRSNPLEVDSLFKRTEQVVSLSDKKSFVRQEPTCPPRGAGESAPKSRILEEKKVQTKNLMCMEKTTGTRTGRKPKNDPTDHKYSFRLNAEENTRFEQLLADSGAGNLTLFIKKSIFSGQIKVVKIDKATMDYYIRLTEFHKQFQAVGNNYNQVVRALKNNFGEKRARALLYKLERLSLELMLVCKKVMALTQEYERKWLQK